MNSNQEESYLSDPLVRKVQLSLDTTHFIYNDNVGRYLVDRAHRDRIEALEQLAVANPNDSEAIIRLQWQVKIPDLFLGWLDEAIAEGMAAEEIISLEDKIS